MSLTDEEQAAVEKLWLPPRRRCVCRGEPIDPVNGTHEAITTAIQGHQQTDRHQTWSVSGGMEHELTPEERVLQVQVAGEPKGPRKRQPHVAEFERTRLPLKRVG